MKKKGLKRIFLAVVLLITSIFFIKYGIETLREKEIINYINTSFAKEELVSNRYIDENKGMVNKMNDTLEKYFILAYFEHSKKNDYKSKQYLEIAIKYIDKSNNLKVKLYNGRLLSYYLVKSEKYDEAIEVVDKTLNNIPERHYNDTYEDIWKMIRTIIDKPNANKAIITMLNKFINSNKISDKTKLYMNVYLVHMHILERNYLLNVEHAIKGIQLAEKLDDKYLIGRLCVDLGLILGELDGYDMAEDIIKESLKIKIEDKKKDAMVKGYGYINLAEIYLALEEYDKVIEYSDEIEKYEGNLEAEDYNDFDILRDFFQSISYLNKGNEEMAEKLINSGYEKLIKDKREYVIDKDMYYYDATARFYDAKGDYEKAINYYCKTLEISKKRNLNEKNIRVLNNLINIYGKLGDQQTKSEYQKLLVDEYEKHKVLRNRENNTYIIDKVESENKLLKSTETKVRYYRDFSILIILIVIILLFVNNYIRKLKKQSNQDGLTGIYNRRYFDAIYGRYLNKKEKFSIIMIDIDNFKIINDTYGHKCGDTVIKDISNIIRNTLDIEDKVFRYGGEEFSIIIKNKELYEVIEIAERIRCAVQTVVFKNNIKVTISMGIGYDDEDLLEKADKNLYIAKRNGKNKVVY